jgi:hypothetical protein
MGERNGDWKKETPAWLVIGHVSLASSGLAAEITKLSTTKPKYSYNLGIMVNGEFKRHIPLFTTGQGKVEVDDTRTIDITIGIQELQDAFRKFCLEDAQQAEDAYIERRQEKENRHVRKPDNKKQYKGPRQRGDAAR